MHVDPNYYRRDNPVRYAGNERGEGMNFECRVQALAEGGSVEVKSDTLRVRNANSVTLLLSAATSFSGFDQILAWSFWAGRAAAFRGEQQTVLTTLHGLVEVQESRRFQNDC